MASEIVPFETESEKDRKALEMFRRAVIRQLREGMADLRTAERMAQQGRKKLVALARALDL